MVHQTQQGHLTESVTDPGDDLPSRSQATFRFRISLRRSSSTDSMARLQAVIRYQPSIRTCGAALQGFMFIMDD